MATKNCLICDSAIQAARMIRYPRAVLCGSAACALAQHQQRVKETARRARYVTEYQPPTPGSRGGGLIALTLTSGRGSGAVVAVVLSLRLAPAGATFAGDAASPRQSYPRMLTARLRFDTSSGAALRLQKGLA